ncbi:hypothetical protein Ae201684P_013438 [Aphanomyces euteiches]|uniref:Tc1-like transposase DDE domain-containing protein n=1 Tax=Aphanomyces euteiches TaxID=100861 RepID=A0A6G0WFT3_9STRA|nr:hypothetical protein Ae201684_016206 [Aphanomyces euteiches]KAH9095323.1 hypothetical protein Ae201684P_013438 [Aphanomyces euteiches]
MFVECCRLHAHSEKSVRQYPGEGSVWILDGAKIHLDAGIVYYLRSIGIIPIYIPAYCPFFNPIEYLFGLMKKSLKRQYVENSKENLAQTVAKVVYEFQNFDLRNIFNHCGFGPDGCFDPRHGLENDKVRISKDQLEDVNDLLDFSERNDSENETNIESTERV